MKRVARWGAVLVGVVAGLWCVADEWHIVGEFESLAAGRPDIAVLKVKGGIAVEVPIAALSEADRRKIATLSPVDRPADGQQADAAAPAATDIPAAVKEAEAVAASCQSVVDAVRVYRIFLAAGALSAEESVAAGRRLASWRKLASEQRVRGVGGWVSPAAAIKAHAEAGALITAAADVLRLGNVKVAIDHLQKAMRVDPGDGRAAFLLGVLAGDIDKAIDFYAEAIRRDHGNGYALNNLAVCEAMSRKGSVAVGHFRQAAESLPDARVVVDNVGLIVASANKNPRWKMSEKVAADYAALYRSLTQEGHLRPVEEGVDGLRVFGPDGNPRAIVTKDGPKPSDLAAMVATSGTSLIVHPQVLGIVVAPGRVLAPASASAESFSLRIPGESTSVPATVLARLQGTDMVLLAAENLDREPLAVVGGPPSNGLEITVVAGTAGLELAVKQETVSGAVVAEADGRIPGDVFVYSARVSSSRGGGAIVDSSGRLRGVVVPVPQAGVGHLAAAQGRGLGVPVSAVESVLAGLGVTLARDANAPVKTPAQLREQVDAATVIVVTGASAPVAGQAGDTAAP